jgi:hypothetical protein
MPSTRRLLGLTMLAAAALALRLGAIWLLDHRDGRPATYEHGEIAANLATGRGFVVKFLGSTGPTSQEAPFYPALLAGGYRLFGIDSRLAVLSVQGLQAVVGTLLALSVVWLAWSLVPQWPTLGWVAGWLAAIHPAHVYMVSQMQVVVWAAWLLTLLLALVASPKSRHAWWKALVAGVLAGWLLLVEPILSLALPVVAWLFWRGDRDMVVTDGRLSALWAIAGRLGRLLAMTGMATLVIAPWLARNARVHGEPVFIKSTFGYAFWQGNNPASWGTDKIPKRSAETIRRAHDGTLADRHRALWAARRETLYIDDVLLKPTGFREFAGLSEPARSRLLGARAYDFVRREPRRYLDLCWRRLRYFLLFDETNPKASDPIYRIVTVTWLVLVLVGLLVLGPRRRPLRPTIVIFVVITAFHALTITSARFRIPLEPMSLVWAAAALAPLVDRVARLRPKPAPEGLETASLERPPTRAGRGEVTAAPDQAETLGGPHRRRRSSTRTPFYHSRG